MKRLRWTPWISVAWLLLGSMGWWVMNQGIAPETPGPGGPNWFCDHGC